jgi:CheY-like chemotaxis protein
VLTARNGQQGLEMALTAQMDMIITDLKMPKMDGFQLLEQLRKRFPAARLVVITAFDDPEVRRRIEPLRVERFLEKPLDLQSLVDAIEGRMPDHPAPPLAAPALSRKSKRVLYMDDDATIRAVAGLMLRRMGHDVLLVNNGEDAVASFLTAAASGDPFDVLIFDLYDEGGIGGMGAARKIWEAEPGTRIILASGSRQDPVFRDYAAHGFAGALEKPYSMHQLENALHKVGRGQQ